MSNRKPCGYVKHNGQNFPVYLDDKTEQAWVEHPTKNAKYNIKHTPIKNCSDALAAAEKMINDNPGFIV
jgi:hypothetical protein